MVYTFARGFLLVLLCARGVTFGHVFNRSTDEIPAELARLPRLQMVHLADNKLSGWSQSYMLRLAISSILVAIHRRAN